MKEQQLIIESLLFVASEPLLQSDIERVFDGDDTPSLDNVIIDINGKLVSPNSPKLLAIAIQEIIKDKILRQKLIKESSHTINDVLQKIDRQQIAKLVIKYLDK